jgi:glutamate racemase
MPLVRDHMSRSLLAVEPEIPVIGTVPAIKPAAQLSRSKRIAVLATPGTVARDYTHDLVQTYAADCEVTLVGSRLLAGYAEAELAGSPVPDEAIAAELAPCFVADGDRRTDVIALACTHYPLLLPRLEALAPWPVTWLDPAPAIARRVVQLLGPPGPGCEVDGSETVAVLTGGAGLTPALVSALRDRAIAEIGVEAMPLAPG